MRTRPDRWVSVWTTNRMRRALTRRGLLDWQSAQCTVYNFELQQFGYTTF